MPGPSRAPIAPPTSSMRRDTLSKQIFDALLEYITDNDFQPGTPLPSTAQLCETYDASRPVVREALSALEAIGLVELRNGRPTIVRELDFRLIEIFLKRAMSGVARSQTALMEVRLPLEIQAARLAAERATPDDVAQLRDLLDSMEPLLLDTDAYPRLDVEFHSRIAAITGNLALIAFAQSLRTQLLGIMVPIRAYREAHNLIGIEHTEHRRILEAVESRDPDAAEAAMRAHMRSSMNVVETVDTESHQPR